MKKLLILISILVLFAPAQVLSAKKAKLPAAPPDKIDAIESTYYALNDLSSKFTQTTEVQMVGKTVTKNGTFKFKKSGKLRIEYAGKESKNYVSNGQTLWIYVPGDDTSLQTFEVNDETVPKEALSFMGGFGKMKKEFAISSSGSFPEAATGTTALHLISRGKIKHYESLEALFGPDNFLIELIVRNTSGNTSRYKFSEIRTNTGLPDALFTLSKGKATPDTLPK